MKLYSDFPARRARQVLVDVVSLGFIAGWVWLGAAIHGLVGSLTTYGAQMEEAGAGFRVTMVQVGESLGGVPLIGEGIRAPFDSASGAGGSLEQAGRDQQALVEQLALTVGVGVAALPILMILALWLIPRIRFARRAHRTRGLLRTGAAVDLLALRALAGQKMSSIASVDADAMGAWRRATRRSCDDWPH